VVTKNSLAAFSCHTAPVWRRSYVGSRGPHDFVAPPGAPSPARRGAGAERVGERRTAAGAGSAPRGRPTPRRARAEGLERDLGAPAAVRL